MIDVREVAKNAQRQLPLCCTPVIVAEQKRIKTPFETDGRKRDTGSVLSGTNPCIEGSRNGNPKCFQGERNIGNCAAEICGLFAALTERIAGIQERTQQQIAE